MTDEEKNAMNEFQSEYDSCKHNESDLIIELETAKIILNLIQNQEKESTNLKSYLAERCLISDFIRWKKHSKT